MTYECCWCGEDKDGDPANKGKNEAPVCPQCAAIYAREAKAHRKKRKRRKK